MTILAYLIPSALFLGLLCLVAFRWSMRAASTTTSTARQAASCSTASRPPTSISAAQLRRRRCPRRSSIATARMRRTCACPMRPRSRCAAARRSISPAAPRRRSITITRTGRRNSIPYRATCRAGAPRAHQSKARARGSRGELRRRGDLRPLRNRSVGSGCAQPRLGRVLRRRQAGDDDGAGGAARHRSALPGRDQRRRGDRLGRYGARTGISFALVDEDARPIARVRWVSHGTSRRTLVGDAGKGLSGISCGGWA